MSLTCTNTGNCHSVHVPVITYLPLVKATESVLPTLLLIRDTIACHGIWVNLHRHHHWRQQCLLHFVLVSIRTCKTWASVVHDSHFDTGSQYSHTHPCVHRAHFLWRTNIAGTYNPFNWHLQLSNCRTLGRAGWFIHNNWSTPFLTTRPVLLRAWHIGFKDQNSATPPPPPSPPTITDTCRDTTQACWPHYHHLGSWLSLSTVWSRLPAEKTPCVRWTRTSMTLLTHVGTWTSNHWGPGIARIAYLMVA